MGDAYEQEKRLIRRRFRDGRSQLWPEEVARLSAEVCARVSELPSFTQARHVVAYAAIENELDPAALVASALAAGKSVYLPAAGDGRFSRYDGNGHRGAPGEAPPGGDTVFLVPGVAFDERGVRLGRGGGWYDRVLAQYAQGTRIGLAYEFQVVPELPEAPWDVRMHAVATEARLVGTTKEIRP